MNGILVYRGLSPSSKFTGTHLFTWVKRGTIKSKMFCSRTQRKTSEHFSWQLRFLKLTLAPKNFIYHSSVRDILIVIETVPYTYSISSEKVNPIKGR